MIRHIVMWRLHEQADSNDKETNIKRVKDALIACSNCVPGILEFDVVTSIDNQTHSKKLESTMDIILNSLFIDHAALDAYQVAPLHEIAKELIGKLRIARECFDYLEE